MLSLRSSQDSRRLADQITERRLRAHRPGAAFCYSAGTIRPVPETTEIAFGCLPAAKLLYP
jgi:hypothetical protein